MFIVGNLFFFWILPMLQTVHWYRRCVQRHHPEAISGEVNFPLLSQPDLALRNGYIVACFHPDMSRMRGKVGTAPIRGATKFHPLHFGVRNLNGLVLLVQMVGGLGTGPWPANN